jgi:hypothetical protein
MLRGLIKKELREHFPIGIAGFVFSVLLLVPGVSGLRVGHRHEFGFLWDSLTFTRFTGDSLGSPTLPVPIAHSGYLTALSLIACAVGLWLGIAMSFREEVKGTWAFLIHRPVARSHIIGAKLLGACALYAGAVAIPYAALALWCAVPGNCPAPWAVDYLFPGLDILARGAIIFLGAFLCGVRPARWYATRFVPLFAAVTLVILSALSPVWWVSNAVTLLTITLFLAAVWATLGRVAWLRPALVLVLAVGLTPILWVPAQVARNTGYSLLETAGVRLRGSRKRVVFSFEGEPLIVRYEGRKVVYETLEGTVVHPERDHLLRLVPLGVRRRNWKGWETTWRPGRKGFSVAVVDYRRHPLDPERERITYALWTENLLVAYDEKTRDVIGYIGRDGFGEHKSAVRPFARLRYAGYLESGDGKIFCILSGERLYQFDWVSRRLSVRREEKAEPAAPIFHMPIPRLGPEAYYEFKREGNTITISDGDHRQRGRFTLPEKLKEQPNLEGAMANENLLVARVVGPLEEITGAGLFSRPRWRRTEQLYKLAPDGTILGEREVTLGDAMGPAYYYWLIGHALSPGFLPLGHAAAEALDMGPRASRHTMLRAFLILLLKLAACGFAAWLILRRRGMRGRGLAAWTGLAFLSGIPALFAIWAELLYEDKRLPCPACGARRPLSRLHCPRCGAGWPAPERRETDLSSPVGSC